MGFAVVLSNEPASEIMLAISRQLLGRCPFLPIFGQENRKNDMAHYLSRRVNPFEPQSKENILLIPTFAVWSRPMH